MTNIKKLNWKILYNFDIFGKETGLYYKGKEKMPTYFGSIISILFFIIYSLYIIYKFKKMIKKEDIVFHEQIEYFEYPPSIKLTRDIFYGGFALENPFTYDPFIDETIYYPKAFFKKAKRNGDKWSFEVKEIELERCNVQKFGKAFQDKLIHNSLYNLYCFKEVNETLEGHFSYDTYSFFYIQFFPCVNSSNNNNHCKSIEEIDFYLNGTFICFEMEDIELTPNNYSYPVRGRNQDIYFTVGKKLFQEVHIFYQYTIIETDLDILGIDEFRRYKTQKFLKYHSQVEMTNLIENDIHYSHEPFCSITIKLFDEVRIQKRTYTKLINVLGDIGGLMEISLAFLKMFSSFSITMLYELSIINHLFEFDIKKKKFVIHNKYKEKYIKEDKIFNYNEQQNNIIINNNSNKRTLSTRKINNSSKKKMMNNNYSNENLIYKGTIQRENRALTNRIFNMNNINNIQNKRNNKSIILKSSNVLNNDDNVNENIKNNVTENENNKNIKKIKINKIFIYFCFFFVKRRNNMQDALLKEGMKLFINEMDIINIFRNLASADEKKNDNLIIEMDDSCKEVINNLEKIS